MLSQGQLHELLSYSEETGVFTWRTNVGRKIRAGKTAGYTVNGYVKICINGKAYFAHRLAWLFVFGTDPDLQIDHANRIKTDNRICNLRLVTAKQNNENKTVRQDNKTGHTGIYFERRTSRWTSQIYHQMKRIHLGTFATKEGAILAYDKKAKELFTHRPSN